MNVHATPWYPALSSHDDCQSDGWPQPSSTPSSAVSQQEQPPHDKQPLASSTQTTAIGTALSRLLAHMSCDASTNGRHTSGMTATTSDATAAVVEHVEQHAVVNGAVAQAQHMHASPRACYTPAYTAASNSHRTPPPSTRARAVAVAAAAAAAAAATTASSNAHGYVVTSSECVPRRASLSAGGSNGVSYANGSSAAVAAAATTRAHLSRTHHVMHTHVYATQQRVHGNNSSATAAAVVAAANGMSSTATTTTTSPAVASTGAYTSPQLLMQWQRQQQQQQQQQGELATTLAQQQTQQPQPLTAASCADAPDAESEYHSWALSYAWHDADASDVNDDNDAAAATAVTTRASASTTATPPPQQQQQQQQRPSASYAAVVVARECSTATAAAVQSSHGQQQSRAEHVHRAPTRGTARAPRRLSSVQRARERQPAQPQPRSPHAGRRDWCTTARQRRRPRRHAQAQHADANNTDTATTTSAAPAQTTARLSLSSLATRATATVAAAVASCLVDVQLRNNNKLSNSNSNSSSSSSVVAAHDADGLSHSMRDHAAKKNSSCSVVSSLGLSGGGGDAHVDVSSCSRHTASPRLPLHSTQSTLVAADDDCNDECGGDKDMAGRMHMVADCDTRRAAAAARGTTTAATRAAAASTATVGNGGAASRAPRTTAQRHPRTPRSSSAADAWVIVTGKTQTRGSNSSGSSGSGGHDKQTRTRQGAPSAAVTRHNGGSRAEQRTAMVTAAAAAAVAVQLPTRFATRAVRSDAAAAATTTTSTATSAAAAASNNNNSSGGDGNNSNKKRKSKQRRRKAAAAAAALLSDSDVDKHDEDDKIVVNNNNKDNERDDGKNTAAMRSKLHKNNNDNHASDSDDSDHGSDADDALLRVTDDKVAVDADECETRRRRVRCCLVLMGVPLYSYHNLDELCATHTATTTTAAAAAAATASAADSVNNSNNGVVSTAVRQQCVSLRQLLQRSCALGESASAKALLLQRALGQRSEAVTRHCPALVCAVLLEASECLLDTDKAVQCGHEALQLARQHSLSALELLARLAITRALARVIDIRDAHEHLQRAAALALSLREHAALGWVALQLGITLELRGCFSDSLRWYSAAAQLARATRQPRLSCDALLSRAIACYAVGDTQASATAYAQAVALLHTLPRAWRQRPLQSLVQVKLQAGDVAAALQVHEEELALAKELGDAATAARCLGSMALVQRYECNYDAAVRLYLAELAAYGGADVRQAVESLCGAAAVCLLMCNSSSSSSSTTTAAATAADKTTRGTVTAATTTAPDKVNGSRAVAAPPPPPRQRQHSLSRAYELACRALQQARLCGEACTLTRALLELAEVELCRGAAAAARARVSEAVATMLGVDAEERRHYLVKATLCELEWRCCGVLVRLALQPASPSHAARRAHDDDNNSSGSNSSKNDYSTEQLLEALVCQDVCNVPNTTDIRRLLRRRVRMHAHTATAAATSTTTTATRQQQQMTLLPHACEVLYSSFTLYDLVNTHTLAALLCDVDMRQRALVCFALPWTETSPCTAMVVRRAGNNDDDNGDGDEGNDERNASCATTTTTRTTTTSARTALASLQLSLTPLSLTAEVIWLLVNYGVSALATVFDAPMYAATTAATTTRTTTTAAAATTAATAADDDHDGSDDTATSQRLYGDTPLWPQHYTKIAFDYEATHGDDVARLRTDVLYCLQRLYDTFVRPLPLVLRGGDAALRGVVFVGDGIFSRIPFHALHDGSAYLVQAVSVSTCSSLALLLTLHAAECAQRERHRRDAEQQQQHVEEKSDTRDEGTAASARIVAHGCVGHLVDMARNSNDDDIDAKSDVAVLHTAACTTALCRVRHTSIDTAAHTSDATHTSSDDVNNNNDDDEDDGGVRRPAPCAYAARLLAELQAQRRDTHASNALYAAVHDLDDDNNSDDGCSSRHTEASTATQSRHSPPSSLSSHRNVLELRLPIVPEISESFCGYVSARQRHVLVAHAADIANTWNLSAYELVVCSSCGTYAGLSIHETGVPVYRALSYASARRLLLPVGSRVPREHGVAVAAVTAAATAAAATTTRTRQCVADAMREAQCRAIAAGAALDEWALYTLCGLP